MIPLLKRKDIFLEIRQGLPREGPGRNKYTRRAFRLLPIMDKPRILDIGCGLGGQTIELAKLSGSQVIGLDIHQPYLDELRKRLKQKGLKIVSRQHGGRCSILVIQMNILTLSGLKGPFTSSVLKRASRNGESS